MGKKRIGWLYGKPIIIGDKNLLTKNETHTEQLNTSSDIIFYKIKDGVDVTAMLDAITSIPIIGVVTPEGQKVDNVLIQRSSTTALEHPLSFSWNNYGGILGFKISRKKVNTLSYISSTKKTEIWEFAEGDIVEKTISLLANLGQSDPQISDYFKDMYESTLEEITEEEYDKLK